MSVDMSPEAVLARLNELAALYIPETLDEARARLEAERPPARESLAEGARRRLEELRALDELTRVLHRGRVVKSEP